MSWQQQICKGDWALCWLPSTALFPPASQVLFCRYNDPSYVKLEKLEIMVKLASAQNIDQARAPRTAPQSLPGRSWPNPKPQVCPFPRVTGGRCNCLSLFSTFMAFVQVLMELKEYASEVDVEFVRKVGWLLRCHTENMILTV